MLTLDRNPILGPEIFLPDDIVAFPEDTPPTPATIPGIIELLLKNPLRLDRVIRDVSLQGTLIPRFLAIELAAFVAFTATLAVVMSATGYWPKLTAIDTVLRTNTQLFVFEQVGLRDPWANGSAFHLVAAYTLGLIVSVGVCLPSLYFYGLLAGVRMSMLDVVSHAVKSQAAMAIVLVGILPMYVAFGLGVKVFELPAALTQNVLLLGLVLPFLAGLWGTQSLHVGFMGLADTLPAVCRGRRACFLRRLLFSWAACWTAVTPVMIFTLWEYFGRA